MKRLILNFGLVLILSGCVASLNHRAPFNKMVGQELTLKEPAVIVMTEAWVGSDIYWTTPSMRKTLMKADDKLLGLYEVLKRFPAGTPLWIWEVRRITTGIGPHVLAICVFSPGTDDEMEFIYRWGEPGNLNRAPWEEPIRNEKE